jgi:hypothetical protein
MNDQEIRINKQILKEISHKKKLRKLITPHDQF